MKRSLVILILVALIGAGIFWVPRILPSDTDGDNTAILTDTAEIRDLVTVVPATGEVLPLMSSVVKSEISGRIVEIFIEEGDTVTRGQKLIELDRTSLETRLREAQRNQEAERLRLERSERNFSRLEQLFEKEFVGEQEFLDAQTALKLSQINLEIAQARMEDAAEDLSKTTILAPHDGVVTRLDMVEGQVISGATSVSNGTDLLTVAQLNELYMEANINEVDVWKLNVGQLSSLRFDAIPDFEVEGEIRTHSSHHWPQ